MPARFLSHAYPPRRARTREGAVLFEYVLLLAAVLIPLLGLAFLVSDPAGRRTFASPTGETRADYGVLGQAIADAHTRSVYGLALPVP